MRICMLIDAWEPVWGGGQTHVWEISQRLVKTLKCQIDIYSRKLISDEGRKHTKDEVYLNQMLQLFRIGPITTFFNLFGRCMWLTTVILAVIRNHRRKPYQLIHAHAFSASIPGKILSILLEIPIIFTVHGSPQLEARKNWLLAIFESLILTRIPYHHLISVSKSFLDYPNVNKKITVIPNGIDISKFDAVKNRRRNRKFTFIWVGRFDVIKGVDILIQALSKVIKRNSRVRLLLVGYGYAQNRYEQLAQQLNLIQFIRFIPKQNPDDLIRFYKKADVFILPSLAEGQSITLLEAWAAKIPVIVSAVGDNKLFVKPGVNGYLVNPGSVFELSQAMNDAINNPHLRKLGNQGYLLVKNFYTWDIAAKQTFGVYKKVLFEN